MCHISFRALGIGLPRLREEPCRLIRIIDVTIRNLLAASETGRGCVVVSTYGQSRQYIYSLPIRVRISLEILELGDLRGGGWATAKSIWRENFLRVAVGVQLRRVLRNIQRR